MKLLVTVCGVTLLGLLLAPPVQAIVFLPALILIPIAKVVGIVIAGLSVPAVSVSALYSFLFKKSLQRSILSGLVILLILAVVIAGILHLLNPDRPLW